MQSNKRVSESFTTHIGCEFKRDNIQLYSDGGQWYIASPKVQIKREYPLFYDTVYGREEDNVPLDKAVPDTADGMLYIPISSGTATVLGRHDGYADFPSLLEESRNSGRPAQEHLNHPVRHDIVATLNPDVKASHCYIWKNIPEQPSTIGTALSTVDKYTLDIAGTLLYNVSLPVTAPFRFFFNFFTED